MSTILEKAKALVDDIYKSMTKVETCEAIAEAVAEQEVVLVKPGGERYTKLDGVLTGEQLLDVKKYIQNTINENKAEAELFLRKVSGKAATINQDFEDAVQEMMNSAANKKPEDTPKMEEQKADEYPEMTVDEVRKVYTRGDMTILQAADYFGVDRNKLYRFITNNGLKKPKKDNTPWREGKRK